MKSWVLVMMVMSVGVCANPSATKNYNEEEHKTLCDLLKAASSKWKSVKNSDSPMKKALEKAVFGESVAAQTASGFEMPGEYTKQEDSDDKSKRKNWCGTCSSEDKKHYPGESATHDLLCLCTPGQLAYPLNGANNVSTLCGKTRSTWGGSGNGMNVWYTDFGDNGHGKEYLTKTWTEIITVCLKSADEINLETALKTFTDKIKPINTHKYLGEHKDEPDCSGIPGQGVCVKYCPNDPQHKPWWARLEDAIQKDKEESERQKSKASEKGQKLKASNRPQTTPEKSAQSAKPAPRASKSSQTEETQGPQRAEQVISNINSTIEEDSSTIILPFWLLLAALSN
ncbi:Variant surface glycoprotein [Trypanosoma congolense IL3000]|uniref:Variant surface glycoprotein n=1 Tax=Trypanosoma congolense (strain IL3000) TaxID=1068625 RepID=F9WAY1_TRYCI|nr:Variant surface glycoprotein [Trypanosoma congolense IL3000]